MRFPHPWRLLLAPAALLALAPGALASALGGPSELPYPARGLNLLVVGTDSRAGITADEKERFRLGGQDCDCADVVMLVHVSAANDRVSVVSLPRDSLVELPGPHTDRRTGKVHDAHLAKLNAAHAEGGSSLSVETVEAVTGLRVHRFLAVDFRRFMDAVDQVDGGVPICTAKPLKDPATGLDLAVGTTRVDGGGGLQYVRSRKADGEMDFGRIRKQHKFVVNMLDRLRSGGILDDPARLRALASTLRGTAAADRGVTAAELLVLATRLKEVGPSRTEFATVPVRGFNPLVEGVGSTVGWDEEGAAEVFARLRADRPLPPGDAVAPSTLSVADYEPARGSSLICP
ncbi:LCP family protein [Streptomyces sp. CC208A]|uniref:LCP family protein n=1 Tax=Streptomyces sp. CC208A TaxID=3044573 RepID=UPI0024A9F724|nr:LCP family protein [Streptomyces sp. CC208A]